MALNTTIACLPPILKATKKNTFNNISVISWLSSYGIPTDLSYVTDHIMLYQVYIGMSGNPIHNFNYNIGNYYIVGRYESHSLTIVSNTTFKLA